MEKWKPIKDYEGLYEVSNYGRVKSLHGKKKKILKICFTHNGYCRVGLYKNNKIRQGKVHRLVAKAFIKNPNNKNSVANL